MNSVDTVNQRRHGMSRPGTKIATFIAAGAMLFTAACSSPTETQVEDPSRVLQSVDVDLSPDGSIKTIAGTAVYYDEAAGTSSSATTDYEAADVFNDLPVRVSTQYRTASSSGSNLEDLNGYTGQVALEITLENLTVASQDVTFDVAGQSQVTPALIGVPLSIAASTKLEGITPSDIVTGSSGADSTTNGIISATAEGDTIIQWAAVIAPPMTGATSTFTLVADVTDFEVPNFDVALQTGLHTDLSYEGVLNSAFDTDPTSDLALQQRTISVITDVNSVLTKAGTTISEVRTNLEDTSATLGVRTAQQLRDSSESLAGTMERVGGELTALEADLNASVSGTNDSVTSQLAQTVGSMNAMLGDTTATPPLLKEGEGCSARVETPESGATIYSAFLQLSGQLDAYSSANAECRDEIVIELQSTIGPRDPGPETCEKEDSLTCALYDSSVTISETLIALVVTGQEIVAGLDTTLIAQTLEEYVVLSQDIDEMILQIETLKGLVDNTELINQLDALADNLKHGAFEIDLKPINKLNDAAQEAAVTATAALEELEGPADLGESDGPFVPDWPLVPLIPAEPSDPVEPTDPVDPAEPTDPPEPTDPEEPVDPTEPTDPEEPVEPEMDSSIIAQNQALADLLCEVELVDPGPTFDEDGKKIPAITMQDLRGYLTDSRCKPWEKRPVTPEGFSAPLEDRLADQVSQWEDVLELAELTEASKAAAIELDAAIQEDLDSVRAAVDEARDLAKTQGKSQEEAQKELDKSLEAINHKVSNLKQTLDKLEEQQEALSQQVLESFETAVASTDKEISKMIQNQIREVSDSAEQGQDSLIESYNRTISDLSTTSEELLVDSAKLIDSQKAQLEESTAQTVAALSNQTVTSLEMIAASSSSSTRDVEAASVLLGDNLNRVLLDLGDRNVQGSGLLGAIAASAAKAETADYQLALASQNASGYANIRSQDITAILLKQAQFEASLSVATQFPAFHLEIPAGANSTTMYSFHLSGSTK